VAIRSTLTAGTITLQATRDGLDSASVTLESKPVKIQDGLSRDLPPALAIAAPAAN